MVINLSDQKLDDKMYSLLKGLNFAVTPRTTPIENILAGVGEAVQSLSVERAEKARPKLWALLQAPSDPEILTKAERKALQALKKNTALAILLADNDNASVIISTVDYKQRIIFILEGPSYRWPGIPLSWQNKKLHYCLKVHTHKSYM